MHGEMSGEKLTDTTHISSEFPIKSKKKRSEKYE
jgi:hypothetical protein